MKRALVPAGVVIAVVGFGGVAVLPAGALPVPDAAEETTASTEPAQDAEAGGASAEDEPTEAGESGTPTDHPTQDDTAEDDATEFETVAPEESSPTPEGTEDEEDESEATADDEDLEQDQRTIVIEPERLTASQFADPEQGVSVIASGFAPGETVTLSIADETGAEVYADQRSADDEGTIAFSAYGETDGDPSTFIGTYTATVAGAEDEEDEEPLTASFSIVADDEEPTSPPPSEEETESPAERALAIEPEEISTAAFVDPEQGVTITASGFTEGETVTLEVVAGPENVTGVELTETADEDGAAVFTVYGVNAAQPAVYIGSYEVAVTGADDAAEGEDPLTGSFAVVAPSGGGGEDSGGATSRNLPHTGTEVTGLGAGLALLIAGAGSVLLTTRRARGDFGPADI